MRHRFIALLVLFTVIFFSSAEAQTTARKFEAGKNTFLLDGKPFVVKAAELHLRSIPVFRKPIGIIVLRCVRRWE